MIALLGYLAVGAVSLWGSEGERPRAIAALRWAAISVHLAGLAAWAVRIGGLPLTGPGDTFASLALLVGLGSLYARRFERMDLVSGLLEPLAAVLLALGLVLPSAHAVDEPAGAWLFVHVAGMVVGSAAFAVSFGISVTWLRVRRRLKTKKLVGLSRLPSLDQLDKLNTRFVVLGFAALTVGISIGGVFAHLDGVETMAGLDPTIITTLLLWAWYAVAIQLRVISGWRGRVAALFSVVGFAVMLVCFLLIQLAYRGWHP